MATRVVLSIVYHEMARRILLRQTPEEIAQAMGIPLSTVRQILAREDLKTVVAELRDRQWEHFDREQAAEARDLRAEISKASEESFDRLLSVLRSSGEEKHVINVAQDMLDRAGYGKRAEAASTTNVYINPIDASVIVDTLKKEAEGASRNTPPEELAKHPKDLDEHPLLQRQNVGNRPPTESS